MPRCALWLAMGLTFLSASVSMAQEVAVLEPPVQHPGNLSRSARQAEPDDLDRQQLKPSPTSAPLGASTTLSYALVQLRLAAYLFLFWTGVFLIVAHKYELARLKHTVADRIFLYIINRSVLRRLFEYLRTLYLSMRSLNFGSARMTMRSFWHAISTILKFFFVRTSSHATVNNSNNNSSSQGQSHLSQHKSLGAFLYQNLKTIFILFRKTSQSISSICSATLPFSLWGLLMLPVTLRDNYVRIRVGLGRFRIQMEQLVQIIRLPIEILSLIFRLLGSIVNFLQGLQKPKIPKL